MEKTKSTPLTTPTSKTTSKRWSDAWKTWKYQKPKIDYTKEFLLHLMWNDWEAMERLIIRNGWMHLKWVHLLEKEKLDLIQKFVNDRKKYYTLEGRLGKDENPQQLKLL